jgi:hypothetical protein
MQKGDSVVINVTNTMPFATTTHWHGMHLPAVMDGGPHQLIEQNTTWVATWRIKNRASTYWYHPHPDGFPIDTLKATGWQVYQGMTGMLIVKDTETDTLGLPAEYGVDDIPIILQDRSFTADSSHFAPIPLTGNPIHVYFDSHYRQEAPQQVYLNVANWSGETLETLLHYSSSTGADNAGGDVLNHRLSFSFETDESGIYFNWEMVDAGNNWYWAIDNVKIQSQTTPIGDLNYDGNYDVFDLLTLVEILVGVLSPESMLGHVSDINQDGETNFTDLILLLNYIMTD